MRSVAIITGFVVLLPLSGFAEESAVDSPRQPGEARLAQSSPGPGSSAAGTVARDADDSAGLVFGISAGGSVFTGRRDLTFGTEQGPGFTPAIGAISYDVNETGATVGGTIGYRLADWLRLELSSSFHNVDSIAGCAGTGLVVIPLINGSTNPAGLGAAGLDCVNPAGNFASTLDYDQRTLDARLDASMKFWEAANRRGWIEGVVGVAYLNLHQGIKRGATGAHLLLTPGSVETEMDITDNLAGGRLGARTQVELAPPLRLVTTVVGDFYGRWSHLGSTQTLTNVEFDSLSGVNLSNATVSAFDSNDGFVPRLEAGAALFYDLTSNWTLGLYYAFDGF